MNSVLEVLNILSRKHRPTNHTFILHSYGVIALNTKLLNSDIVNENIFYLKQMYNALMKWCINIIYGPRVWGKYEI